jgi:hypothetical protein
VVAFLVGRGGREAPCRNASTERTIPRSHQSNLLYVASYYSSFGSLLNMISAQAPIVTNIAQGEEAAAIAAMFQAQDANWDETQDRMSQFVSAFSGILCFDCSLLLLMNPFSCLPPRACACSARTVPPTFEAQLAVVTGEELPQVPTINKLLNIASPTDLCRPATYVTAVARKAGLSS